MPRADTKPAATSTLEAVGQSASTKAAEYKRSPRWARTSEVSRYSGYSSSFYNKARLTGKGPKYYRQNRVVIYDLNEVDDWLKEQSFRSTSEYEPKPAKSAA